MEFSNLLQESQHGASDEEMENSWKLLLRSDDNAIQNSNVPKSARQHSSQHVGFVDFEELDDEDETRQNLDPAWGIKHSDTAQLLDSVHRSPSFPAPQYQLGSPSDLQQQEEQHTYNTEHEESQSMYREHDESPEISSQLNENNSRRDEPMIHHEVPVTREESRFEEGLPLMGNDFTTEQEAVGTEPTLEENSDGGPDGHSEWIGQNVQPVHQRPAELERKDTVDVLHGMDLDESIPDSPPPGESDHDPTSPDRKDGESALAAAFAEVPDDPFAEVADDADDPWKAAMGEDDEFLVEDADDLLPDSEEEEESEIPPASSHFQKNQLGSPQTLQRQMSNPYAPHQPTTSEFSQFGAGPMSAQIGLRSQVISPQTLVPQPNITNRAESFVDQSKGGYKSPYDLPMDLAPKRKAHNPRAQPASISVPPPPRSSSLSGEKQLQSPFTPTAPVSHGPVVKSPIMQSAAMTDPRSASVPVKAAPTSKKSNSGFFEELPIAARARPSFTSSRPAVQTSQGPPRSTSGMKAPAVPNLPPPPAQPLRQDLPPQQDLQSQYQLQRPAKLDPFSNASLQPIQSLPVQAPSSRYSPAPPTGQNPIRPSPSPRYSPAPPQQPSGVINRYATQPAHSTPNLPFQPRTSSPLAQHRKSVDEVNNQRQVSNPSLHHSNSTSVPYVSAFSQTPAQTLSPPQGGDPTKKYEVVPPRRSQTQSPSRQMPKPSIPTRIAPPPNRPASAFGELTPARAAPVPNILSPPRVRPVSRVVEQVDYIQPTDETQHDPLGRWKGAPIFAFGFGGNIVTSFPQHVPRFGATIVRPQIKVNSGPVTIRTMATLIEDEGATGKFPGPLKIKSKKKDLVSWLSASIASLETTAMSLPSKQLEEKIILWKVVKVLVEQDGNLESPQSVQTVSAILMPGVYGDNELSPQQDQTNFSGIYRPAATVARSETVDPAAIETLRKMLLAGKRENAIWQAVDNRLWAHALLIASTVDPKVWRQVVQEFVKQEVKTIGNNAESLCALYEVLGGNLEESVDHLVPPSARAGLQMVSKADVSGPVRNALDGLDRWKETLCLILNNRSTEDQRALTTLARLLADYGRVEAAHICYLFARTALPTLFGGIDDPSASIVLLGADHLHHPLSFNRDTESIMLTEVYEFAMSTLAPGSTGAQMPHLAVYKLQRANELAETGSKAEAQAYCDAIAAGLKSSTKHSLYYHPILLGEVEDLSNRLKQVPLQNQSWMAKPSIEKVSGSVWNKFSSFVTGDDSDAESKGSARDAAEAAPFANVAGSPGLSRNSSQTDLYGSYPTAAPVVAPTSAGSRYAPNGMHSTRSSSEIPKARPSLDSQRSPPSTSYSNEPRAFYGPTVPHQTQYSPMAPPRAPQMNQPSPEPPMPPVAEESIHTYPTGNPIQSSFTKNYETPSYLPEESATVSNGIHGFYGASESSTVPNLALPEVEDQINDEPELSSFEPPQPSYGGYEAPESTGYIPYQPEPESDEDSKPRPKKQFAIDDDDDDTRFSSYSRPEPGVSSTLEPEQDSASASGAVVEPARRKANDEAADAAFKAAAEADAKRAAEEAAAKKASGSWLGGWFGGAKKAETLDSPSRSSSADKKVHRVHLGESKMKLYYDKDKGKWINPDNPEASEKKAVAPPPRSGSGTPGTAAGGPPMGGPPRSVSSLYNKADGPNGGQPSRTSTPASTMAEDGSDGVGSRPGSSSINVANTFSPSTTQSLGLSAPAGPGNPPGPPSRPASALSNVSGLDDLLGPSTGGRKVSGRNVKGKKGRYVDVMAK